MIDIMDRLEVKKLKKEGLSNRKIAKRLGIDRETVVRILSEEKYEDYKLRVKKPSLLDPYTNTILNILSRNPDLTKKRIFEIIKDEGYPGGRTIVYDFIAKLPKNNNAVIRFEGLPGEYLQFDFGTISNPRLTNENLNRLFFFAARLKYSRTLYVEFCADQSLETLIRALLRCFEYIGGVVLVVVMDNIKTVVVGRKGNEIIWNKQFLAFAYEIGFKPEPCWPASPQQKGQAENLVGYVKRDFYAGRSFADTSDINRQAKLWIDRINSQANQATDIPAFELLEKERARLSPLKITASEYGLPLFVKVGPMSTVYVKGNFYSVPNAYIGKNLLVKLRADRIDIYDKCDLAASHERCFESKKRILVEEHYRSTLERKPRGRVMFARERIRELGAEAEEYLTELVFSNQRWESHISRLYELLKTYGKEKTIVAIRNCLLSNLIGAEYIEATLSMQEYIPNESTPGQPNDPLISSPSPNMKSIPCELKAYEVFAINLDSGDEQ
jgi:transposase